MNLVDYDPVKDEVVVTKAGLTTSRKLKTFIESGQVDELSKKDQARLFQMLKDHPYVVTDKCTFGSSYSFSLNTQKKVLRLLRLSYMAVVILCPLVFLGKLEVLGIMLTGGYAVFSFVIYFFGFNLRTVWPAQGQAISRGCFMSSGDCWFAGICLGKADAPRTCHQ
ncbi:hypothetical protein [Endozoicomonas sp.]|uniref:hypothetical protein n=1 Tax=Endozoicomonas sp. TaxID=1892382 RepID=UPI00383B69E8